MDRKKAIGLASSVSVAAAGAVLAVGANFGLFGLSAAAEAPPLPVSSVGEEGPVEAAEVPALAGPVQEIIEETRVIDVPVHVPAPAAAPAPATGAAAVPSDGASTAPDDPDAGVESDDTSSTGDTTSESEDHAVDEDGVQPCEVHDDGKVECHDEDD